MQYRYSHFLIRYFTEFKKLKVYSNIYVAVSYNTSAVYNIMERG